MPTIHDETGDEPKAAPGSGVASYDPLSVGWGAVKGALKEGIQNVESIPGVGSMPKEGPVMSWAGSTDPEHSTAEAVGRFAGDVAPLALLPELSIVPEARTAWAMKNAFNKLEAMPSYFKWGMAEQAPQIANDLNRYANWVAKGAIGGASQAPNDPATGARIGAETGVGSQILRSALQAAYRHRPSLPGLIGLAALAYAEKERLRPYLAWHAGLTVPGAASAVLPFLAPGVAGAMGERAARATGWDRQPSAADDSDERIKPSQ